MALNHIEKRLLKYIPKRAQPYLTWLDRECGNYLLAFDLTPFAPDAKEDWQEYCDTVDELRWYARQFAKTYIDKH